MRNSYLFLTFLSLLLFCTSCRIEKRMYMQSYDLNPLTKANTKRVKHLLVNRNLEQQHNEHIVDFPVICTNSYNKMRHRGVNALHLIDTILQLEKRNSLQSFKDSTCSAISLRNGETIKGIIIEVGITEIKYKKCDLPTSPIYTIRKADASMIEYPNGQKDIFKIEDFANNETEKKEDIISCERDEEKVLLFSIVSFVLSLIALPMPFFIPSVYPFLITYLSMLAGGTALFIINKNPLKLKGKGFAIAGLIIGWITLFIVIHLVHFLNF